MSVVRGRGGAGVVRAAALLALAACAPSPAPRTPSPALCQIETTIGEDRAPRDRVFPVQYWFVLLLKGYRSSGEIARPARDCRGLPATVTADTCDPEGSNDGAAAALRPSDLHITGAGETRRLVWIEATQLPDGRAEGPVALVDVDAHGLSVRAMGVLRGYRDNVTMRLARMEGGTMLVAESERCPDAGAVGRDRAIGQRDCDRAMRVLPLVGDRFLDKPLTDARGHCLGSTLFPVREAGASPDGTRYQLEATITFGADAITVREQLALSDSKGRADLAASSFVTRVQSERRITLSPGGLVASEPGLLARWLARAPAAKPAP
jgi:hypothetical protein